MKLYDHLKIEAKWQKYWEKKKLNHAKGTPDKKKFYALIEFPYPSGSGLHVGHIRSNTAMDIVARKRRREGYEVLYPIGWDAFGLPTENYALKTGKDPRDVTTTNTDTFRRQLKSLGFSFDWSREINTTDPTYYRWTQWIFLQFLKKGLAYKKKMEINWCPKDLIGLANEEVVNGCCERCGTKVEKREKEQWMLAITQYADRLDADLDSVNYLERIKIQQRNWIGKSEGAEIGFLVKGTTLSLNVFTTRPDTIFGVTYVVISPESSRISDVKNKIQNWQEVETYIQKSKNKTDIERTDAKSEKTGVELKGVTAINPATGEEIPVWIADYVLADYGTGVVMAVPAHDERDFDFAKKYGLKIKNVITPVRIDPKNPPMQGKKSVARKTIHALVIDPTTKKILCMKWKKQPWTGFVVGGVDEGEDIVVAARREVLEETGYKNLKFIKVLGNNVHAEYYAAHKDENRIAYSTPILFELENEERDPISQEEMDTHEVVWLDPKTLTKDNFTCAELDLWLGRMNNLAHSDIFTGEGILSNSGKFDGKDSLSIKKEITESVGGKWVTKFKLRDWVFSRQRYWGEPIPVVHCEKCGIVSVPEKDLPVELPKVKNYQPTQTGESPLSLIEKWVNTKCPRCKGKAKRETDTMPQWAGSSWYYLRYIDPENTKAFADPEKLKYWTPVDWYNGGMEHTTLHLLYSRFWHKFLFDLGIVPTSEPYQKRTSHGLILAEGGEKMSKSVGNVVNPDEIVKTVGADTLRVHEMFMGPFDQAIAWDTNTIAGSRRFIERIWKLQEKVVSVANVAASESVLATGSATKREALSLRGHNGRNTQLDSITQKTIQKVSSDIEDMKFNTAISTMMILVNDFEKEKISAENYEIILQLLAPFAPHVTDELWSLLGHKTSIHTSPWPHYNESKIIAEKSKLAIQVNGKVRGTLEYEGVMSDEKLTEMAQNMPEITKWIEGKTILKVIVIKGKVVNIVV